jgi:hypothetical protein
VSNTTYLVFAVTADQTAGPNTLSVTSSFTTPPTFTQIGSQQNYGGASSNAVHYTAWYTTGGSGAGTITVNFTNNDHQAYIEIISLGGNNTANPVANAGFHNSGTAGTAANADLPSAPSARSFEVAFVTTFGDPGGTAPTSSQPSITLVTNSYLHGGGGTTGTSVVAFSGGAQASLTLTLGSSKPWGTMSLEINPSS